jgi:hypothetical protein
VVGSYLIEWSFRGYLPFSSLRGVVPWYDTIPQLGAVLFLAGWWALRTADVAPQRDQLTIRSATLVVLFAVAMSILHKPRVDALFVEGVATMSPVEQGRFPTVELQKLRADYLADQYARWQRRHLRRMDHAQVTARRLGIGRREISETFGRVDLPELPKVYDGVPMLDLPWSGTERNPDVIRRALSADFAKEPEPVIPSALIRRNTG